jgi:hypothetical protein
LRKKRIVILSVLLVAALLGVAAVLIWLRSAPRVSGPVRHEVYVWQRAWTQPVREAVAQHATDFAEVVALKAEISWKDKQPQLTRANVDYATLAATKRPVGIALRIGPYSGPFTPLPVQGAPASGTASSDTSPRPSAGAETGAPPGDFGLRGQAQRDPAFAPAPAEATNSKAPSPLRSAGADQDAALTESLCDVAARIVNEARTNGVALAELQVDFDCAESKLDGYRVWVEAMQQRVAPLPVTITALPSWLDSRAFKRLASVATNYVLQVHSVARPRSFDAPFTLCDPRAASRAVERAGRIGIPFRVALPTYGYTLAFDAGGKFLGLSAEGPRPNWPTNAQLREVYSDPIELASLVQQWTASRPAALRGVIWYRLPTIVDNFNWRWPTLGAILAARVPQEQFRVNTRRVESGLVEISLANEGELDISSRLAVEVRWSSARLVAGDALRDFELADRSLSAARFQTRSQPGRIRAGETLVLGWLRFDRDCEVRCELKKL